MTPERNEPCPCGSGKKYKKCHGLAAAPAQRDYIALNRRIAYMGNVGRVRAAWCAAYAKHKQEQIAAVEERLRAGLLSEGKSVTCGRGCAHCCYFFVVASLQECEAIVHYLYEHEETFRFFLKAFAAWRDAILKNERCFRRLNQLHERITAGEASEEDKRMFNEECSNYTRLHLPCPFLQEGACSIYPVRPYVCAEVVATTSREWCDPAHERNAEAGYYKAAFDLSQDMPYFVRPSGDTVFASLPFLVYRLLEEGYDALAQVPGLEFIKADALRDPEVRACLG